jgi:hypothetical protein
VADEHALSTIRLDHLQAVEILHQKHLVEIEQADYADLEKVVRRHKAEKERLEESVQHQVKIHSFDFEELVGNI